MTTPSITDDISLYCGDVYNYLCKVPNTELTDKTKTDTAASRIVDAICSDGFYKKYYNSSTWFDQKACDKLLKTQWRNIFTEQQLLIIAICNLKNVNHNDQHYYSQINKIIWPNGSDNIESDTQIPKERFGNTKYISRIFKNNYRGIIRFDKKRILFIKLHNLTKRTFIIHTNGHGFNLDGHVDTFIKYGLHMNLYYIFVTAFHTGVAQEIWDTGLINMAYDTKTNKRLPSIPLSHILIKLHNTKLLKQIIKEQPYKFFVNNNNKSVFDVVDGMDLLGNKLMLAEFLIEKEYMCGLNEFLTILCKKCILPQ